MNVSVLRCAIAWFCLVLALFASVAPRQGFVLCIEADGCLSVAPSLEGEHCDGCEPHGLVVPEVAQAAQDARVEHAAPTDEPPCPCLDLEVPGSNEVKRVQTSSTASLNVHVFLAHTARKLVRESAPPLGLCLTAAPAVPRPPPLLAHVASVVIRA